jgi:hypothetical protein
MEATLNELRHIIAAQAGQIERNKQVIAQLISGLYSQRNQKRALIEYMKLLYGEADGEDDDGEDDEADDGVNNMWPTTAQGSEHEIRLQQSEENLQQLEEKVAAMEKKQIEKGEKIGLNM